MVRKITKISYKYREMFAAKYEMIYGMVRSGTLKGYAVQSELLRLKKIIKALDTLINTDEKGI